MNMITRGRQGRLLHRIFELGVIAKGIDGALELIGGLLLLFLSPTAITGAILFLVQGELKEDPTDLVANLLRAQHWNDHQQQSFCE
jgi:uncharacterized membrane protein